MRIAIIGAGPAGATLAILLASEGATVTLFDDGRRPDLLVGESLVPALVPTLQRLGVEQEVADIGRLKPGVSFEWSPTFRFSFTFARFAPAVPPYTYNVPRPQFDDVLLARARAAGTHHVVVRARLEPSGRQDGPELRLAPKTLAAAPALEGRQPDLIVDATGRVRLAGRTLGIEAWVGPRNDVAHFAHYEDFQWDEVPGQLVLHRLEAGWSWCIPLRDRLSVGIVIGRNDMARLGATPVERLTRAIEADPYLKNVVGPGRRVTPAATYTNYQLVSGRALGPGWVSAGDAFGHVDPMLSPGLYLGMHSAELIADALAPFLRRGATPSAPALASALDRYARTQRFELEAWIDLVAYLYDGRLAAMIRAGRDWIQSGKPSRFKTAAQNHIERQIALRASAMRTSSRYCSGLMRLLGSRGLRGVDPAPLAIR